MDSPRKVMLDAVVAVAKGLRHGSYDVLRGFVAWSDYTFDPGSRAMAVIYQEGSVMGEGPRDADIALEVFAAKGGARQIDDALMDELHADVGELLCALPMQTDSFGDSALVDVRGARAVEVHDVARSVQGIVVTFKVHY